ncbi:MAG: hypothetical protein LBK61_07410 [Spirochaetaceae bacterium]|nr:hypothetical protein [Spirochaetaceae bacterium]
MKTNRFFLFGLLAVLLALGLVLAGCGGDDDDDSNGGGGPATLSDYAGDYPGAFNQESYTLTVTANSLAINDPATTTISSVTTSEGGTYGTPVPYSWVYLNADGKKIGIAVEGTNRKNIYLGQTAVNSFTQYNDTTPATTGIQEGTITGFGTKLD